MLTGTVKFFNDERGYGFIVPDAGGPDHFVHVIAVKNAGLGESLEIGQRLSYDLRADVRNDRERAVNLVEID